MSNNTLYPEFTHHCEECIFLGTIRNVQTILVTDEVCDALTAHIEGEASIADLHEALGVLPLDVHDLYLCHEGRKPRVIARYNDTPTGFKYADVGFGSRDPELAKAEELAGSLGLLQP